MRIAFVRCSEAEVQAATARLGHDFRVVDVRRVTALEFDVAIVGSAAIVDGHLPHEIEARVDAPIVVMLRGRDDYARCLAPFPLVAIEDADRLPIVARRLMNLRHLIAAKSAAEERLAAREAQLSFAQELARLGSWEWDAATNRISLSPEMVRTFELHKNFSSLDEWLTLVEPEDTRSLECAFAEALETGEPVETRFRARRSDGALFFVHSRMKRVGGTGGQPVRIVGISQDITIAMQAEQTLRESEARYRTLVEQAKDIIVAFDVEGRVQSLNQAFEELTGWSRVEWIGEQFLDALDPESRPQAMEHIRAILAGEALPPQPEYRLRTRNGGSLTVEGVGRRVESGGRAVGVVVVVRNVTARKEADARAEKEKRLASLGQLATSVAHEFNNVLMSIMPFAELLQRRSPEDTHVESATQHIIRATRRGREISQEILRF
ncbi:MAG TPA: PAS domain S-box protein, partial [Thermoanaerobaculia bacterium]